MNIIQLETSGTFTSIAILKRTANLPARMWSNESAFNLLFMQGSASHFKDLMERLFLFKNFPYLLSTLNLIFPDRYSFLSISFHSRY